MYRLLFLTLILYGSSGSTPMVEPQTSQPPEIIADFMEFDLQIGPGLEENFAITWPRSVIANKEGDIFVVEGDQILIFDRDGQPKQVFGSPGTDPGEFENLHYMTISDTGLIVAAGGQFGFTFQIFTPGLELISKMTYMHDPPYQYEMEDLKLHPDRPRDITAYSPSELCYYLMGRGDAPETRYDHNHMLIHEQDEVCTLIANYEGHSYVHGGMMGTIIQELGVLHYGVLTGRRMVYAHGEYDRTEANGEYRYLLNIVSLDDHTVTTISHPYTPVPIGDASLGRFRDMIENARDERTKDSFTEILANAEGMLEGVLHKVPLSGIMVDNGFIFAWTYTTDDSLGTLVDIFDADSSRFLRSAFILPAVEGHGYLHCIRNGFAYTAHMDRSDEGNSSVSRFVVNPMVYRR